MTFLRSVKSERFGSRAIGIHVFSRSMNVSTSYTNDFDVWLNRNESTEHHVNILIWDAKLIVDAEGAVMP